MGRKRIAIACQGGGTHAAFTWGVLTTILKTKKLWDARSEEGDTFDIVSISGTSAGALCALATWYGLVPNAADPECGTIDKAIERLDLLWTGFAATTPVEIAHNTIATTLLHWKARGVPFPGSNPNDAYGTIGLTGLSMMGARPQYLEFPALLQALCPHFEAIDWPAVAKADLRIMVGAIEVLSGNFEIFDSDKTLEEMGLTALDKGTRPIQYDAMADAACDFAGGGGGIWNAPRHPSGASHSEYRLSHMSNRDTTVIRNGYYWDGLYSQNPPVRDLLDASEKEEKPDEIWIVRINPQEFSPASLDGQS